MGNETASFNDPQKNRLDAHAKAWADVYLGVRLWRAALPINIWLTLFFYPPNHIRMKKDLKNYPLTDEEVNTVYVFMLLYGYSSVESLLEKTIEQLQVHKDWNDEIEACIVKMKAD